MALQTQSEPSANRPENLARWLIRSATSASLGTILDEPENKRLAPYTSLVQVASDMRGRPILLLSDLAQHTLNLKAENGGSLLIDDCRGLADPLTGPRVSLIGILAHSEDEHVRERYLRRFPEARNYAEFVDFQFYVLEPRRAHLVAGFGKIDWIEADSLLLEPDCEALSEAESGIVNHMNADHADALERYATVFSGAEPGAWKMTGIDPEGFEIVKNTERLRISFDDSIRSAEEARGALVGLLKKARAG